MAREEKLIPTVNYAGLFVRDYIYFNGPATAWELFKAWRDFRRTRGHKGTNFLNFWSNVIYPLKRLGLLIEVGEEPGKYEYAFAKKILDVDRARLEDPAWWAPKRALYGEVPDKPAPSPSAAVTEEELELLREFEEARKRGRLRARRRG